MSEEIIESINDSVFFKFEKVIDGVVVGRAFLFVISNDLHDKSYGLLEDIWVEPNFQGKDIGTELVKSVIEKCKSEGLYKLLATSRKSREQVHSWYERLGFDKYGHAFRMDF